MGEMPSFGGERAIIMPHHGKPSACPPRLALLLTGLRVDPHIEGVAVGRVLPQQRVLRIHSRARKAYVGGAAEASHLQLHYKPARRSAVASSG